MILRTRGAEASATFARPVTFGGTGEAPELDPSASPILRALAFEVGRRRGWIVAVGVRPTSADTADQQAALARAFLVVDAIRRFAHLDTIAETIGWKAVARQPDAARTGFGVLLLPPVRSAEPKNAPR